MVFLTGEHSDSKKVIISMHYFSSSRSMPIFILVRQLVLLACINSVLIMSPPARTINKTPLNNSYFFSRIESIFGMEVPWHDRHQPTILLLCELSFHGNQGETLIIPFSSVVLSQYLVWRFLGMTGINQLHCCYGNSVSMATSVKH